MEYMCNFVYIIIFKNREIMKNQTIYKVGQYYTYKNENPSKIIEVRKGKYTFIKLKNGNLVSVCK